MFSPDEDLLIKNAYRKLPDSVKNAISIREFTADVAEHRRQNVDPAMSILAGKLCRGEELTTKEQETISALNVNPMFAADHYPAWVALSEKGNPIRIPMLVSPYAEGILCWWCEEDAKTGLRDVNGDSYRLRKLSPKEFVSMQGWWGWVGIPKLQDGRVPVAWYSQLTVIANLKAPIVDEEIAGDGDLWTDTLIASIDDAVASPRNGGMGGPVMHFKKRGDLPHPRYDTDDYIAIDYEPVSQRWRIIIQGIAAPPDIVLSTYQTLDEAMLAARGMFRLKNRLAAVHCV